MLCTCFSPLSLTGKHLLADEKAAYERQAKESADSRVCLQREIDRLIDEKRESLATSRSNAGRVSEEVTRLTAANQSMERQLTEYKAQLSAAQATASHEHQADEHRLAQLERELLVATDDVQHLEKR